MENSPQNPENIQANRRPRPQLKKKKKKKDFINNSGQGDVPVVRVVSARFNWGVFFFSWIWGIYYKKYITLLMLPASFLPVAPLILSIWFGIKGNTWAWQNKRYKSIKEFHDIHKKWACAGVIVSLLSILICAAIFISSMSVLGSSLMNSGFSSQQPQQIEFIPPENSNFTFTYSNGNTQKVIMKSSNKKETKKPLIKKNPKPTYDANSPITIDITQPYSKR